MGYVLILSKFMEILWYAHRNYNASVYESLSMCVCVCLCCEF